MIWQNAFHVLGVMPWVLAFLGGVDFLDFLKAKIIYLNSNRFWLIVTGQKIEKMNQPPDSALEEFAQADSLF